MHAAAGKRMGAATSIRGGEASKFQKQIKARLRDTASLGEIAEKGHPYSRPIHTLRDEMFPKHHTLPATRLRQQDKGGPEPNSADGKAPCPRKWRADPVGQQYCQPSHEL